MSSAEESVPEPAHTDRGPLGGEYSGEELWTLEEDPPAKE